MANVVTAIQIVRELEKRGWGSAGGEVFQKRLGAVLLRCKMKGHRALFYRVGVGPHPAAERFVSVYYKTQNAVKQAVQTMHRFEAEVHPLTQAIMAAFPDAHLAGPEDR